MTEQDLPGGPRGLVRRLAYPVRRALAPAALEVDGQVRELATALTELQEEHARFRAETEARLAALDAQAAELREGVSEARRLNLRIAELTDIVTELVLPLHDREIDATALRTLRPDTR
jgi:cell division septum initiation protein DivIVA